MAKTKVVPDPNLLRTNRMYISLREIGEVNEKDKSIFAMGYSGKHIADPDRPLSSAVFSLIVHVANLAKYTTEEDREADLARLKELVNDMSWFGEKRAGHGRNRFPNPTAVTQQKKPRKRRT